MKLAIASPERDAYSETFISMQASRLPCALRIYGRPVASGTDPGGPIRIRSARGLIDLAWHSFRHGLSLIGPQVQELKRRLRRRSVNVVLANYGPTGVALQPVCEALSIPLVVHFHGYDAHVKSVVDANRAGYRELGQKAAHVVVVSEFMAESLMALGIPERKLRLVRCGVDPDRFLQGPTIPDDPVFLAVGRFVDKKAPHLTVLAFHKVHQQLPKARLVMAGEGGLLESTQNLAMALGLRDAVSFPGVLSQEAVAQQMGKSTAFVQHSITPAVGATAGDCEGTPVAVLEAMMAGLPVIATRHTGIGEVIEHERNGFLCEERDVKAMSDLMFRLALSPELGKSVGQAARSEAKEKYSAGNYCESLRRILVEVVERRVSDVHVERSVIPREVYGLERGH
jgi:colanic acid/amylovoran biosynthesis glycosyltransferase